MKKDEINRVRQLTGSHHTWLINTLQDKATACAHLQAALEMYQQDGDKKALLLALKDVTEAQGGVGLLSKKTNLNREHLYYILSGRGNPKFDTLAVILKAFGFYINILPIAK